MLTLTAWLLIANWYSYPTDHTVTVPGIASEQECQRLGKESFKGLTVSIKCVPYQAAVRERL